MVVPHHVQLGKSRRMWNIPAVLAALKVSIPHAQVVPLDMSLVKPGAMAKVASVLSRADVVVTGVGLYNLHHVLLKPTARVVEVETTGVAWEDWEVNE